MPSDSGKLTRAVGKLPVIGQLRKDEERKAAQDSWFSENHGDEYFDSEPTVWEWVKGQAPSKLAVLYYIADTFPCSKWLFNYNLQWFLGDLVAGITVGAVCIPQVSNALQLPTMLWANDMSQGHGICQTGTTAG